MRYCGKLSLIMLITISPPKNDLVVKTGPRIRFESFKLILIANYVTLVKENDIKIMLGIFILFVFEG